MSEFTPGPWLITDGNNIYALNEDGTNRFAAQLERGYTATTKQTSVRTTPAEMAANARLIAAAPAMYEALTALVAKLPAIEEAINPFMLMGHVHGMRYSGPNWKDELEAARTALAAADGKDAGEPAK